MSTELSHEQIRLHSQRALEDSDFVRNHLFIGMQRKKNLPLVKKDCPFAGAEQYLYLRVTHNDVSWHVKLQKEHLEQARISHKDAWKSAFANMTVEDRTVITSLPQEIAAMTCGLQNMSATTASNAYILTNPGHYQGAAQILSRAAIRKYFARAAPGYKKMIVFPSSVHECILVPVQEIPGDLSAFHAMVREVNQAVVNQTEQLSDYCYVMEV